MTQPGSGRQRSLARKDRGLQRPTWQKRLTTTLVVAVAVVAMWLIGAALLPRWWANRVSAVVDGSIATGVVFGIFIGFVFTVLPLVALWIGIRSRSERRTWKGWLSWLVVAALAAMPNLLTLGIVFGRGDAAREKLNVRGDGFRTGSLIGAIAAGVGLLALGWVVRSRRGERDRDGGRDRDRRGERRRRHRETEEIADREPAS